MQYHKASQIGHERSKKAQLKLFDYTGYAMLTYTTKNDGNDFVPVGEEMLVARITRANEILLVLCDIDGYVKAQSKPIQIEKANEIFGRMKDDGLIEYQGDIKTVS